MAWLSKLLSGGLVVATAACGSSGDTPEGYTSVEGGTSSGTSGQGGGAGTAGKAGAAGKSGAAGKGGAGKGGAGSSAGSAGGGDAAGVGGGAAGSGEGGAGGGLGGGAGAGGQAGSPGKGPPYPIVLAHGFFGFDKFAGANFVTYFYQVKDHLADAGETEVFTPAVDPFNGSALRGQQLAERIDAIIKETGAAKVNLIGHSQGGLDARVAAHLRPDLVASVTTFATPHRGTRVADVALGLVSDPNGQALLDALVQIVGAPLYDEVGNETSLSKSLAQLSTGAMVDFNAAYPDLPGLPYRSFTGRSKYNLGGDDCATSIAPPFVSKYEHDLDPLEPLLTVPGIILDGITLLPPPHDGLVPVSSARWGQFMGCVPADHFDEIGQLFGDKPGLLNPWDYQEFYLGTVKLLRAAGL